MKRLSIVFLLLFSVFAIAKSSYRPPLVVENVVSDDVRAFLERSQKTEKTIKRSNYDPLGRKKTGNVYPTNYVIVPEETMEVDVAYLGNHKPSAKISGRYEYEGEIKKFWFNGKSVSENEYFERFSNSQNKTFRNPGFRKIMTASEIEELLNGPQKVFIQKAKKITDDSFTDYGIILGLSEISTHAHSNGYKGAGIGIYFDEESCPNSANVNSAYYSQEMICVNGVGFHSTGVISVLQKTSPQAMIYGFSKYDTIPNPYLYTPNIVIGSHSWSLDSSNGTYLPSDYRFDSYVYNERVSNFFSAGNQPDYGSNDFRVKSPALAPNVVAVGAVNPSNNWYEIYSRHVNSDLNNQKPEVANYTEFYFSDGIEFVVGDKTWNKKFDGTSAATPYTAGMIADLFSQHPFFIWHPELVKALLLVSQKFPIVNANYFDSDNASAAKKIPAYSSMAWNHRVAYWDGDNDCCFDANNKITFVERNIRSNSHYRIAIAWLSNPDYILANNMLSQDIDLRIYQDNQLIAFSTSSFDPFELVDFTTTSNSDLTIEIFRFANSGDDNFVLGYCLWNDI